MDLRGVSVTQFAGEVREFMVRAAKLIGAHYPERSLKIFVLNAPWWFNMVWKVYVVSCISYLYCVHCIK
jgi:CRAL/TRIO domain